MYFKGLKRFTVLRALWHLLQRPGEEQPLRNEFVELPELPGIYRSITVENSDRGALVDEQLASLIRSLADRGAFFNMQIVALDKPRVAYVLNSKSEFQFRICFNFEFPKQKYISN